MIIHIENSSKDINTLQGKSLFCNKLAKIFKRQGITIIDDVNAYADASINVIRIKHQNSKVRILRLDGIWHDTGKNYVQKNLTIKNDLMRADAVIYQSQYAKLMADKYLGIANKPTAVIFNGSEIQKYDYGKGSHFITFSKWRPHKRLQDTIESFLLAGIPDCKLIVAGDYKNCGIEKKMLDKYISHPSISYVGNIDQKILDYYLCDAIGSIHLCWFDACPNSVVEALCHNVPVITNNVGGTKELVEPASGYVCEVDKPYDMNPVDLYHPPKINRRIVANAIWKCYEERPVVKNDHLDIENIAEQYLTFIKGLL